MSRVEKTVFVSYRRADEAWAVAVFGDLTHNGYDVFIDYDGIASGNFEAAILENIKARAHFLVLLTPTALKRCDDPKDWMRREIEAALDSKRNIVPLMFPGFDFGTSATASQLTGKLAELKQYNGMPIPAGFFSEAMVRLRKFLNVPVDSVLHPASDSAQQVAKEQKDRAARVLGDYHPQSQRTHRGKMQRCKFFIMSPHYVDKNRWKTLADVLVEIRDNLPNETWTKEAYLIPSGRALPKLRDPKLLRQDSAFLEQKRAATKKFVNEWEHSELDGVWFTMPTKMGQSIGVYSLEYDLFLNASLAKKN